MDFSNFKVLVIGDLCLDIVEEGESHRLAPEAPVPVILNPTKKYSLGMAGNVAYNLRNLGAEVYSFFWAKEDKYYEKIVELLDENNIKYREKTHKSKLYDDLTTIVKKRIFSNNQQIARIDKEKYIFVDEEYLNILDEALLQYKTNEFDFIIISDYNKGFINVDTWEIILPHLERINKGGFFVDTKKENVLDYYKGMYLFPNAKEVNKMLNYYKCPNIKMFREKLESDFLVVTGDEDGAYLFDNFDITSINAYNESKAINTYGAGDVFIAAFSIYYKKYNNPIRALKFANYCCSKAVMKKYTCNVELHEIIDFERKIK